MDYGELLFEGTPRDVQAHLDVIARGAIIASGPCAALREDARVRAPYLGRGAKPPAAL